MSVSFLAAQRPQRSSQPIPQSQSRSTNKKPQASLQRQEGNFLHELIGRLLLWGEEGRDAAYGCLIRPGVALGAAILHCYHSDGYESSTLQGSADISPRLHPRVLIPIVSE